MLKEAFNALLKLNSKQVQLKRFGTPDLYSSARASASNYFRNDSGPSATIIHGREFVIPVDSIYGSAQQTVSFSVIPTEGKFKLGYGVNETVEIEYISTAGDIQDALQDITGLENVTVTGSFADGFKITFLGIETPTLLTASLVTGEELDATISIVVSDKGTPWATPMIKRGDKIIHPTFGSMAVSEIIEMYDVGGDVMGYRLRVE